MGHKGSMPFIQYSMSKNKNRVIKTAKEQMVDSLKLPKDLVMGVSMLSITGCEEAFIENYKGIIECNPCSVMVQTKNCRMNFTGCNLSVDYYTNEEMKISGKIRQISFFD